MSWSQDYLSGTSDDEYTSDDECSVNDDIPKGLRLLKKSRNYLRENSIKFSSINDSRIFYRISSNRCGHCGYGDSEYVLFSSKKYWYVLHYWCGCMSDDGTYYLYTFENVEDAMLKYVGK